MLVARNERGDVLKIRVDEIGGDSRDWDNIGTMVCWHRGYKLGDKHDFTSPEDFMERVGKLKGALILPLFLYDHGGLRMKVGSFAGLLPQGHAEFDSGQVGWIYCTAEKIRAEYGKGKDARAKAEKCLRGEVEIYDLELQGRVYWYELTRKLTPGCVAEDGGEGVSENTDEDSCGGFYGEDWKQNGLADNLPEDCRDLLDKLEFVGREASYGDDNDD